MASSAVTILSFMTEPLTVDEAFSYSKDRGSSDGASSSQFYRPRDDLRVAQLPDLGVAETQHVGQHLVGVLAEPRGTDRCLARRALEIERRTGYQIAPNAGLIDLMEDRIGDRAARVFAQHLAEGLVRTPAHAGTGERRLDLVEGSRRYPGVQDRRDDVARPEAVALFLQIDPEQRLDHREAVGEPRDPAEFRPHSVGDRHDIDQPAVPRLEIPPIGAVKVIAEGRPVLVHQLRFGDVTEIADHRHRHIRERDL